MYKINKLIPIFSIKDNVLKRLWKCRMAGGFFYILYESLPTYRLLPSHSFKYAVKNGQKSKLVQNKLGSNFSINI
jgi:hypothetical protein